MSKRNPKEATLADLDDDEDDDDASYNGDEEEEEDRPADKGGKSGPSSSKGASGSKPAKRRRGSEFIDDAAEEEDDEEDEEDGGKRRGKQKPAKKKRGSEFFDEMADVDDDEDEDELEEEDGGLLIDDEEAGLTAKEGAARIASYQRIHKEADDRSAEEMARYIEERYKDMQEREQDDDLEDGGTVLQQGLLPTVNDPKLWLVTVRPGTERMICVQLLQKFHVFADRGTPLHIKSVVCLDHLKGFIYVEAEKESYVKDAIRGIRNVFNSKGAQLVPLREMVGAITVNRKAKQSISKDSWVRLRTGLYKEDLAKVVDVDNVAGRATVHVLHRLDFQAMANRDEEARKANPFGRAPAVRPPPRQFNREEARNAGLLATINTDADGTDVVLINSHRFKGGYLEKTVAIKTLMVQETMPPLDEIARFNAAADSRDEDGDGAGTDLTNLMAALPAAKGGVAAARAMFSKGDKVLITKGDLANLEAVVSDVRDDGKVMVLPSIEGFNEAVDCDPDELRKSFKIGQRVRVLAGQHAGETGMLLQVKDENCVLLTDSLKTQISVFARDIKEATDLSPGVEVLGEYALHDLVQLDHNTAGLIVRILHDSVQVMTTQGSPENPDVRLCRLPDIQRKLVSRRFNSTMDKFTNELREGDFVYINEGPLAGKGGTIKHIWNRYVFLQSHELRVHGGFAATAGGMLRKQGGKTSSSNLAKSIISTPGASPYGANSSYGRSPSNGMGPPGMSGGRGGGGGGRGGFASRKGFYVDKTVIVKGGPYNGYKGRVKHETATHVQLEMDAISRVVTIEIKLIRELDSSGNIKGGPMGQANYGSYGSQPGGYGSQPGGYGSQPGGYGNGSYQPSNGGYRPSSAPAPSATPMHPSMTPMHWSSQATPMHAPYTPAHAPYTPAHAPTPTDDNFDRHGGQGYDNDRGGRVAMSAPTPGLNHAYTPALTPSGYTPADGYTPGLAPTPHDYMSGPTPGLAPTPNIAATPYLPAQTPSIHDAAPTPANFGRDGYTPAAMAHTPGLPAQTPGLPAHTPAFTPGNAYTPGIPGTPGFNPLSPGPAAADDYTLWENVLVTLPDGRMGMVVSASMDGQCSVRPGHMDADNARFVPSGPTESVRGPSLSLVPPNKNDRIRVVRSEDGVGLGMVGSLVGIDKADGFYKPDGEQGMKITEIAALARLVAV